MLAKYRSAPSRDTSRRLRLSTRSAIAFAGRSLFYPLALLILAPLPVLLWSKLYIVTLMLFGQSIVIPIVFLLRGVTVEALDDSFELTLSGRHTTRLPRQATVHISPGTARALKTTYFETLDGVYEMRLTQSECDWFANRVRPLPAAGKTGVSGGETVAR